MDFLDSGRSGEAVRAADPERQADGHKDPVYPPGFGSSHLVAGSRRFSESRQPFLVASHGSGHLTRLVVVLRRLPCCLPAQLLFGHLVQLHCM